jgi:chitobiase/beta-hexosaminidase-like protein
MKKSYIPATIILAAALAACGGTDFEWFPPVTDTSPPVVTVSGPVFTNSTGHAALNSTVSFSANEPATIYYTTNSSAAETAFTPIEFSSAPVLGFTLSAANTALRFFGIDKSSNKSTTRAVTILSP